MFALGVLLLGMGAPMFALGIAFRMSPRPLYVSAKNMGA